MPEGKKFSGQVAIVTGAGSGLGEAISKAFAREGASVILVDINLEEARRVEAEIQKNGGVAASIRADRINGTAPLSSMESLAFVRPK